MSTFIPQQLHLLQHWITERERIRVIHDSRSPPARPWTADVVLDKYSFCNVVRMDDRVSKWLMKKWYVHAAPAHTLLVQATIARLINQPNTLATFDPPMHWTRTNEGWMEGHLRKLMRMNDVPVFTSAYLVVGTEFGDGGKCSGIPRIISRVARDAVPIIVDHGHSMQAMHQALMRVQGLGSFLAGQITADMRHLRSTTYAPDRMRWAPKGPGSARGIARLLGLPVKRSIGMSQEAFMNTLVDLRTQLTLPKRAEAMDLQNCLCEFDKYCRAVQDGRRPRRLYRGARRP